MNHASHERFMRQAIELARANALEDRAGGPFGAVIVRAGEIVGQGVNRVIAERDSTWHGEVAAIRDACHRLGTHDLSGCDLLTTGYPCPMCYGASWWARIERIYYASSMEDALVYGRFDDRLIYEQLGVPDAERRLPNAQLLRDEMLPVWQAFQMMPNRVHY